LTTTGHARAHARNRKGVPASQQACLLPEPSRAERQSAQAQRHALELGRRQVGRRRCPSRQNCCPMSAEIPLRDPCSGQEIAKSIRGDGAGSAGWATARGAASGGPPLSTASWGAPPRGAAVASPAPSRACHAARCEEPRRLLPHPPNSCALSNVGAGHVSASCDRGGARKTLTRPAPMFTRIIAPMRSRRTPRP
jgi:hypothetical protein